MFDEWDIEGLLKRLARISEIEEQFDATLLTEKLSSLRQLAYGASHEINNPLANIATRAQSLILDEPNSDRRQALAVIYSQAMRAHEMISDMMLFARPPKIERCLTHLCSLVDRIQNELSSELSSNHIQLQCRCEPGVQRLWIDPVQIAVALKALIQNSIDAMAGIGGSIDIGIRQERNGRVCLSIMDNGPGIKPSVMKHVFDPFYSGREAGRGLGFGLSKAWRICQQHGGQLRLICSGPDLTEFQILLPMGEPDQTSSKVETSNNSAA
jgi:signal transduction histidine kinase